MVYSVILSVNQIHITCLEARFFLLTFIRDMLFYFPFTMTSKEIVTFSVSNNIFKKVVQFFFLTFGCFYSSFFTKKLFFFYPETKYEQKIQGIENEDGNSLLPLLSAKLKLYIHLIEWTGRLCEAVIVSESRLELKTNYLI